MKNTRYFLSLFLLTLTLTTPFSPAFAETLTREQAVEMKTRMRDEDLKFQSRLKERLTLINKETWDKMMALKEELDGRKNGSNDPKQHKIYEREYSEKVKKVRAEAGAAKYAAKEQLNHYREFNKELIQKSYNKEPERLDGEAGFRG
jgi:hypothetical protein